MIGLKREDSMGHLVAGGTVANIEAIWVARNLKYYPLGLQEALLKDDQLSKASGYQVERYDNNFLFIYLFSHSMFIYCPLELVTFANRYDKVNLENSSCFDLRSILL